MKETIFRIQDKDGRGPWKPGFSHKWVITRPDHDNLLPWTIEFPYVDIKSLESGHFGCGCRTVKQLRRWFTKKEYKKLLKSGYCAVMIQVDGVLAESDKQLVFKRSQPLNVNISGVKIY